jgi:antitoxin MazE
MGASVKKWGNGAAVRIPTAILRAAHFDLDEVVDVREEAGRIVIEPVRQKTYELSALLKGITRKNLHEYAEFRPSLRQGNMVMARRYVPDAGLPWC